MRSPGLLSRLLSHAGSYRSAILVASFFSIVNKLLDLAPPLLIGLAVDTVVLGQSSLLSSYPGMEDPNHQLWLIAALTLVIWGGESLTEYIFQRAWRGLAQDVQHDLRFATYRHLQAQPLKHFESAQSGELMSILNDDVNQLERFFDNGANDIIQLCVTVVSIGIYFFCVAPQVAWMAFLPMPIIIWGSLRFQKKLAPRYRSVREEVGTLNSVFANNLGGIATIKSFVAEDVEAARVSELSQRYVDKNRRAIALSSAFVPLIRMAIVCGFIATLVYGGQKALDGSLNVGIYSTLVFMTQRLLWPLTRMGQTLDLYQRAMASAARLLGVLGKDERLPQGSYALLKSAHSEDISLEAMSFGYSNGVPVLRDVDLRVRAHEVTAIVGATGSGKSTLLKLMMRFYDPNEGRIVWGAQDLRDLQLSDLRRNMAFVGQEVFLFPGSVRDNIAYGTPAATEEAIARAADLAEAKTFIDKLPQGFDTLVGERGQKLSGGQRQRIAIARAFLKDAPVLLLDEATSAIDNETEAAIQRSLARISKERTLVVVAHRLSTVRNADRIYVLDDGQVCESGKHEELLALDGLYARLWNVQTGGALQVLETGTR